MRLRRRELLTCLGLAGSVPAWPVQADTAPPLPRRRYLRGRFGQLHCRTAEPPDSATAELPLMLLHGFPASGAQFARGLPLLALRRRCLAPDLPGFGDSDAPRSQPGLADYAAAAGEVLDALAIDRIDLLGFQGGCAVALSLAGQQPQRIRSLTLLSPLPTQARPGVAGPISLTQDGSHLVSAWQAHLDANVAEWPLEWAAEQFVDVIRRPDRAWWGQAAASGQDVPLALQALAQPVHLLEGWTPSCLDLRAGELAAALDAFLEQLA